MPLMYVYYVCPRLNDFFLRMRIELLSRKLMPKTVNAVIFRSSVYFFACPTSFLAIAKLPTKNTPLKQTETLSDFSKETFDIDR